MFIFYILVLRKHRVGEWILRFDIQCQSHQSSQNLLNLRQLNELNLQRNVDFHMHVLLRVFHQDVLKLIKNRACICFHCI